MSNFSRSSASRSSRRFLPRALQRGAQLRRLRHDAGRAQVSRPPNPRRALRFLAPLLLVALLIIVGRRYVMQQVDIEGRIRREVIPQLEKQYNTRIEVGRIESDWFSQVTLHDIVVGRDANLPLGALFQTKSATIRVNAVDLALHRTDALGALQSIVLEAPQLYVERDARGQLNLSKLLKSNATTSNTRWTGFAQVNQGRLWYHDLGVRSASGEPLLVDAHGVTGKAQFNGNDPLDFHLLLAQSLFGRAQIPISNVILQGTAGANGRWAALDAAWPSAPVTLLADYAFPKRDVVASAGTVGGNLQLAWDAGLPLASQITVAGSLTSHAVSGYAAKVREPNTNQPLTIAQLTGAMTFNNRAVSMTGVSLVALNTSLRVSGNVALLRQPVFDLTVQTAAADTNRLIGLWHGPLPGGISVSGGSAGVKLHATGSLQAARVDGEVSIPNFRFQQPRYGLVTTPRLDSVIHATGNLQAATIDASLKSSTVGALLPQYGQISLGALRGTARLNGNWQAPHLQADLQGTDMGANLTHYGHWHVASWRSLVNATGNFHTENINAEISSAGLNLIHPQYGAWSVGGLHGVLQASGDTQAPAVNSDVTLTNFAGHDAHYGAIRGAVLHLLANTANLTNAAWQGETSLANLDASQINLKAISPSVAQQAHGLGLVNGRARFTGLKLGTLPIIKGNFQLSHATIADIALRNVTAAASFAAGRLRIAGARAQSDVGPLLADVDTDLQTNVTKLALTAPHTVIEARRLNPYLAAQGLFVSGQAIGRVTVATTNRPLPSTLKHSLLHGQVAMRADGPIVLETNFDFALPSATVRGTGQQPWGRRALKTQNARVQGRGAVRFVSAKDWRFVGNAILDANRADLSARRDSLMPIAWQDRLGGSRLEGVRVLAQGSIDSRDGQIEPHLAGTAQIARGVFPLSPADTTSVTQWAMARDVNLDYVAQPRHYSVPRVFARLARGQVNGHLELKDDIVAGQLLAERLDVAQLQQWASALAPAGDALEKFKAHGVAYARADLTGTIANPQATAQVRLYNGTVQTPDAIVPVDMARASLTVQPADLRVLTLPELTVWSNGGHLAAHGTLTQHASTYDLDLRATLQTVRAHDVAITPGLRNLSEKAGLQALLGGDLHVLGTLAQPRMEGTVRVKLAHAYGLSVEDAQGQLIYDGTQPQPTIQLAALTGHTDGKPFNGALSVDYGQSAWSAQLHTQGANAAHLLQVAATNSDPNTAKTVAALPLRGNLAADVDIKGTIRTTPDATTFVPQTGTIKLQTDTLLWRGRQAGKLTADLALTDGVLHAAKLELRRVVASTTGPNGVVTYAPDALVEVSGVLPVDMETPNLDAQLTVSNEQLSTVLLLLTEVQRTLGDQSQHIGWLDRALQSSPSWPPGLEGSIAVDTRVTGSWRNPFFAVHLASLHNTRAQSDYGRVQALPTVEAAFTYSQGAVTIQRAELRLAKSAGAIAAEAAPDSEAGEDDTVLRVNDGGRIVPGGDIALDAEVLNANLSQLATWVPALRELDGAPALSGVLSQFSFQVGGTTTDPTVTGSITAADLVYRNYTLNRLRVARFDIANGQLAIRPGNLTLVKGDFQSSAASGSIPWSWDTPGPRADGPLEVHLPLQRADFGALAGIFVPAITSVDVKSFSGTVDVTGTLNAPIVGGELSIDDGRFRLNPATATFDGGIVGLTGTIKFINGNQIQIDPNNILRGQLVPGVRVAALATGNDQAADATPATKAAKRHRRPAPTPLLPPTPVNMTGDFTLRGDVALNLDPAILARPLATLGEHRYNLAATIDKASLGTDAFSGLRDISLGLLWRTGPGVAATSQHLATMFAATGQGAKKRAAGSVSALAALTLAPDFATGRDALLRSQVTSFDDAAAFKDFPIYRHIAAPMLQNRSSRLVCQALGFNMRDMGSGILDGTLYLDNQPATSRVLPPLNRVAGHASIATRLAALRLAGLGGVAGAAAQPVSAATPVAAQAKTPTTPTSPPVAPPTPATPDLAPATATYAAATLPVRVSGNLTLTQTQITGVPASAGGGAIVLPDAPRLDLRLNIGHNVGFQNQALSTDIAGFLNVSGTPRDPQIQGTILTRSGQVRFPNAVARITSGEITVDAARDPLTDTLRSQADIDATAQGRVGQYQITMTLRGPLDLGSKNIQNLRVDVTSNPPLSQDEAFAQLLGTSLRDLQTGDTDTTRSGQINQTYARAVVNLISAPLFTGLERSIEKALGISSVVLDYRLDEPLSVEFGKALGDRVYVTYRRSLSDLESGQATPYTLRIDYRIKGNLQLGLETNELQEHKITLGKTWRF